MGWVRSLNVALYQLTTHDIFGIFPEPKSALKTAFTDKMFT